MLLHHAASYRIWLIWILICIPFKQFEIRVFWDLNVCLYLHNFFIIDVTLLDSSLCMHHVGFDVLKISRLRLAPFSPLKVLWKCVFFWNYIYCKDMHSSLKVSWTFIVVIAGPNIKTVKTKENGRCVLDEMHTSNLYFKVISHVTLMWYRKKLN